MRIQWGLSPAYIRQSWRVLYTIFTITTIVIRQFGPFPFGSLDHFHSAVWTIPLCDYNHLPVGVSSSRRHDTTHPVFSSMLRFADLLNLNSNTQTKRLMSVVIFSIEAIAKSRGNGRAGVPPPTADGDGTPSLAGFAIAIIIVRQATASGSVSRIIRRSMALFFSFSLWSSPNPKRFSLPLESQQVKNFSSFPDSAPVTAS